MKQKFKVGDICKIITNHTPFEKGKTVTVLQYDADDTLYCEEKNGESWWVDPEDLKLVSTKSPTLTIKKLTRKRGEKEYHTWQFSVNGKVSNHNFNSPQSRDKSLTRFIKYIQDGDFKIVKG